MRWQQQDFYLPIIEAIQSGLPVVAATGSCLEEAGGPDGLYVSPDSPAQLADSILELMHAPDKKQRIVRTQQYIQKFENNDVARQVLKLYRQII